MPGLYGILEPWLELAVRLGLVLFLTGPAVAALLALLRHLEERRSALRPSSEEARRRLLALAARPDLPAIGSWPPPAELADLVEEAASVVRGELRLRLVERARELGVLDHLLATARARRASLRERAARALEPFLALDPETVRAVLARLLDDRDDRVRIAAAETLLADGDGLARRTAARARHDPAFATPAALRFFERLVRGFPDEAASLLADPEEPRARLVAEAAARTRVHALLPALLAALPRSRGRLRIALVRALVALEHPAGFAALERLAAEGDPAVRLTALGIAAADADPRILPLVRRRLADPDPRVVARALALLAERDPGFAHTAGSAPA